MLPRPELAPAFGPSAHPLSGHPHVDLPLALVASAAAMLVFAVSLLLPASPATGTAAAGPVDTASWAGRLTPAQVAVRGLAVALLAVTIAAGRFGVDDDLENLAPALVVGVAWPVLVAASVSVGAVWRWSDPWDAVARTWDRGGDDRGPASVWPAVVVVVPWLWYLTVYPYSLQPRPVGAVLALYTVLTLAGCLALGRTRWLGSAEPLGILLSWAALLPRGRLGQWQPPRGAEALLGGLAGALLFGAVRRSQVWSRLNADPNALLYATVGMAVSAAVVAGFCMLMARVGEPLGGRAGVARAVVPAVAGIVVAVAMEFNRLFVSVQLVPALLGDPFGWGWDLLGQPLDGLDASPLGAVGLLVAQLTVLVLTHLAGAVVLARRLQDRARLPGALVLLHLMAGSVVAVALH